MGVQRVIGDGMPCARVKAQAQATQTTQTTAHPMQAGGVGVIFEDEQAAGRADDGSHEPRQGCAWRSGRVVRALAAGRVLVLLRLLLWLRLLLLLCRAALPCCLC